MFLFFFVLSPPGSGGHGIFGAPHPFVSRYFSENLHTFTKVELPAVFRKVSCKFIITNHDQCTVTVHQIKTSNCALWWTAPSVLPHTVCATAGSACSDLLQQHRPLKCVCCRVLDLNVSRLSLCGVYKQERKSPSVNCLFVFCSVKTNKRFICIDKRWRGSTGGLLFCCRGR